jgi:hypothetical protein
MSDDQLAAIYTRIVAAREPTTRSACVSPEALRALVEQRGAEQERFRTLNHAMSCPACRRELDLLRAVRSLRPSVARRAAPYAMAASLLLVAGVAYFGRSARVAEPGDTMRSGNEVVLVTPRGSVPDTPPLSLVWRSAAGATEYEVSVVAEDGTRVVETVTRDTTLVLAPGTPLRINVEYAWTVTARGSSGARQSVPSRFRLR